MYTPMSLYWIHPCYYLFLFYFFFIKEKVVIWLGSSVLFSCEVFAMLYVISLCTDCLLYFLLFPGFSDHW